MAKCVRIGKPSGWLIKTFGQREMELAAIALIEQAWRMPLAPVAINLAALDRMARTGIEDLQHHGWIERLPDGRYLLSEDFWQRVLFR